MVRYQYQSFSKLVSKLKNLSLVNDNDHGIITALISIVQPYDECIIQLNFKQLFGSNTLSRPELAGNMQYNYVWPST